jgi:hypothetical protein
MRPSLVGRIRTPRSSAIARAKDDFPSPGGALEEEGRERLGEAPRGKDEIPERLPDSVLADQSRELSAAFPLERRRGLARRSRLPLRAEDELAPTPRPLEAARESLEDLAMKDRAGLVPMAVIAVLLAAQLLVPAGVEGGADDAGKVPDVLRARGTTVTLAGKGKPKRVPP